MAAVYYKTVIIAYITKKIDIDEESYLTELEELTAKLKEEKK